MSVIDYAVEFAVNIAEDDSHGYDQNNRWGPDYDCSSLIIAAFDAAFKKAGIKPTPKDNGASYTGDMKKAFLNSGFIEVPLKERRKGDVLLNESSHCALMVDDNRLVNASINELGKAVGGKRGDQTKKEILVRNYYTYSKGWDCCLRYVGEEKPQKTEEIKQDYHEVVKGDTLSKISKKYKVSIDDLTAWNNIEDKNKIYIGQKLRLTAPKAPEKPKAGDTVKVTSDNGLNIRSGAGMAYSVNSCLNYGDVVKVLEVSNGWGKTSRGWINLDYTKKV